MTLSRQALSLGTKPYYGPLATILLNGVAYDAANVTDDNDKLTFRGGSSDALDVNLAGGDDMYQVDAESEDITNATMRGGEGDDVISVVAGDQGDDDVDFINSANIGGSLIGGPGEDTITVGDGLAVLTGTIKGNEDDDVITVANADGAFVQGNSGDDGIFIGFAATADGEVAGSTAAASLNNSSINGSAGDDQINIDAGGSVTDSTIRGNEGDDVIVAGGIDVTTYVPGNAVEGTVTATGAVALEGNAGDDFIDGSAITGAATIRGGKGDDTLVAGNGQTVFGGLGADTFTVGSSGGVIIEDFDKLDLDGNVAADNPDCFCDDEIVINNFEVETYNYGTEIVKFTSASSWTGDIKVKAVASGVTGGANDTVSLAATKTETLNATAVARLFITETNNALAGAVNTLQANLDAVNYPALGLTKDGATFANGLATQQNGQGTVSLGGIQFDAAVRGAGIGQAFASAVGVWYTSSATTAGNRVTVKGAVRDLIVQTTNNFSQGDFSFLSLTAKGGANVSGTQKFVYDDITNATVKNHHASYLKTKSTETVNLKSLVFGTANFSQVTTGKAFMVLTDLEDQAYKTSTVVLEAGTGAATITLDLDGYFQAFQRTAVGSGTSETKDGGFSWTPVLYTGTAARTPGVVAQNNNISDGAGGVNSSWVSWDYMGDRGLRTLTTTAFNTQNAGANSLPNNAITQKAGINNTSRTQDDFVTNKGELAIKIRVSETTPVTAAVGTGAAVKRTTIFGEVLDITTCPDFPAQGTLAARQYDGVGNANQGDVVGTFNTKYLWDEGGILSLSRVQVFPTATFPNGITNAGDLTRLDGAANRGGDGFFSGTAFNTAVLAAGNFGEHAVTNASANAKDVPFRVLFFDNNATDNGLYVVSGQADYAGGVLTGVETNPTTMSAMGGKHTIVKVSGGKGSVIELSDINFA